MKKTLVIHGDFKDGDSEKLARHFGLPLASQAGLAWTGPVLYLHTSKLHAAMLAKGLRSYGHETRTLNLESALRQSERAQYGCAFDSKYRRRLQGVALSAVETFSRQIEQKVFKLARRVSLLNGASEQEAAEKIVSAMMRVRLK
jgi:hypothetical protein